MLNMQSVLDAQSIWGFESPAREIQGLRETQLIELETAEFACGDFLKQRGLVTQFGA